jgi:WD40 repeat protein
MVPTVSRLAAVSILAVCLAAIAMGTATRARQDLGLPAPGADNLRKDRHGDPLPAGALGRLGTVRLRATAGAFVVLGDGKSLVTVSGGRTVGRWDAQTGLLVGETHLPGAHAETSAISPDGKTLAAVEETGISLWDVAAGKRLHFLPQQHGRVAFAPDSKTLATSEYSSRADGPGKGIVHVWDVATGKERVLAELPSYTHDLAFAPDGRRLYAVVDNHSLRAWDLQSGKQLWQNEHAANTLAVSADGKTLWTNTYLRNGLHLWDADTGKRLATMDHDEELWTAHLALSPDGKHAAQATWHETLLWDLDRRTVLHRFAAAGPQVAFAADGKSLFTAGKLLLRWDVATGKLLYTDSRKDGHTGPVTSLAFAKGGRALATSGDDGTLRLWALADASHRVLRTDGALHGARKLGDRGGLWAVPTVAVCFTPDGRQVLSDVAYDTVALTDVTTGKEVQRFQVPQNKEMQYVPATVRLSADGKTVLAQARGYEPQISSISRIIESEPVAAWNAITGKHLWTRMVPGSFLGGVAFSPDDRLLLAAHGKLTDLKTGGQRSLVDAPIDIGPPVAFAPDGRLLAVTEPHLLSGPATAVRVYETMTGRLIACAEAPLGHYRGLAFSPDGRLLAAAGRDALHIWETATGKRLLHLEAKGRLTQWNAVTFGTCLAFAPDGRALATGHADGTVLLWDLAPALAGLAVPPGPVDPDACWTDLIAADAAKAQAALEHLASAPTKALPLLKQKLGPLLVDPKWLASRLEELGNEKFTVREAAMRDLEKVADAVESELRRLADKPPSLEVRDRLVRLLKRLDAGQADVPPLAEVRKRRAVAVLERIGTQDARAILRELAAGAPDARLTQAAQAALRRLDDRQ